MRSAHFMEATQFSVDYNGQEITVVQTEKDVFLATIDGKEVTIIKRTDNEGGDHWFDEGGEQETAQTKEIGDLITKHFFESADTIE